MNAVSPPRLRQVLLGELTEAESTELCRRSAVPDPEVRRIARAICEEIRNEGDRAMARVDARHGGGYFPVTQAELERAADRIPEVTAALEEAKDRIAAFHRPQIPSDIHREDVRGIAITRRWSPLGRVGAYVPGGKAAYPSTVLMTVVPAKVAGVREVVVATPAGDDGKVNRATLAACWVAGADEVWAMGGAGAVATLAYGTEQVKRVDKIVGPGSQWVTAAKLAVFGDCGIDLPAGPSEVLVLADDSADPALVAADLLCQAEHGPDSPAVLVTTDPTLPSRVEEALEEQLVFLERREILAEALSNHGMTVIASDMTQALSFTNRYAAEHVSLLTGDTETHAKEITAAGSVYIGRWSAESAGDYATGANHVLPTGGLAACYGPLSVDDFGSWRQEQRLTREGLADILPIITRLADVEGFTAHRRAAELRFSTEGAA
ncbi:MAG: histidinol dehydrogenase [Acidimicrobiia bacterium]|nr:histidinol dehydrogenase [Acidimicrobiia bacterium]MXX45424.1 histidinol dehydrogenase [Acidimicrobiia bacterium]MYA38217.1 histidinol dehydrogenase [Acidimicrobiia bacterium]MYB78714.1 histidinol dehydrogenase [Acidimicrobiia bacterium]MYD41777.1 histidinol dehydrogenase [Acidimicrobiia bacterium]